MWNINLQRTITLERVGVPCDCLAYLSRVSRPRPGESPADSQHSRGSVSLRHTPLQSWLSMCQQKLMASRYCHCSLQELAVEKGHTWQEPGAERPTALQDLGTGAAQLHALQESDAKEASVLWGTSKATWAAIPMLGGKHIHCRHLALDKPCILQEPA